MIDQTPTKSTDTQCQRAIKVLNGITAECLEKQPALRDVDYKAVFFGALRMLRSIEIGDDEWGVLCQCVAHNGNELHVRGAKQYVAALEWILANQTKH